MKCIPVATDDGWTCARCGFVRKGWRGDIRYVDRNCRPKVIAVQRAKPRLSDRLRRWVRRSYPYQLANGIIFYGTPRPGDVAEGVIKSCGVTQGPGCGCKALQRSWNVTGWVRCWLNRDAIRQQLRKRAQLFGLDFDSRSPLGWVALAMVNWSRVAESPLAWQAWRWWP